MHQEEVRGVVLLAFLLDHTGGHGNSGNPRRSNHGIDFSSGGLAHHLAQQHAAGSTHTKCNNAQDNNLEGLSSQEHLGAGLGSYGEAQKDRNDVHQGLLDTVYQQGYTARFLQKIPQHQHPNQGSRTGKQQNGEKGNHNGEDNLLSFANLPQLLHLDNSFLRGGEELDDGGLNHRYQGHIAVGGDGDSSQQIWCQFTGEVKGGGTIRPADDADGGRLRAGKSQEYGAKEGSKDAQLGCRSQEEAPGIGQQGTKVGARADAKEDEGRVDAQVGALVEIVEKTAVLIPYGVGH